MALYGGIELPGEPNLENIRRLDLMVLPQLNRMSRYGIAVDLPYLQELSSQFGAEMRDLQRDISSYIPPTALDRFSQAAADIEEEEGSATLNAASAEQIGVLLFELLGIGKNRRLKSTGTGKVSTGKKNLDLIRLDHPVVPLVMQYRERQKLKSTYCDTLPKVAVLHPRSSCCPVCEFQHEADTHRLHPTWLTTRAITGRIQCKKPPLQTIPIRTDLGSRIRAAFLGSPGTRLVSVDFSQMELRDLAHLANAHSMLNIYESGGDIHVNTAARSFGIPAEQVDKYKHRLPAKTVNFSITNGTTGKGLCAQIIHAFWNAGVNPPDWLTEAWCDSFIVSWHGIYNEVQPYFETQYYRAKRYGFCWNPWGRVRYIPQVRSSLPYKVSEGLREAQNFPVTSSNAEQTKLAMAECEDLFTRLLDSNICAIGLLSIHDQIIAEVDENYAEAVGEMMVDIFENVMVDKDTGENLWRCPIKSDCEVLERWKEKAA